MVIVGVVGTLAPRDSTEQKRYKDRAPGHPRRLWRCQGGRRKSRREGNKYQKERKGPHPVLQRPGAHPQGHRSGTVGSRTLGRLWPARRELRRTGRRGRVNSLKKPEEALSHLRSPGGYSGHSGCWR